jgi:hypothetical protein
MSGFRKNSQVLVLFETKARNSRHFAQTLVWDADKGTDDWIKGGDMRKGRVYVEAFAARKILFASLLAFMTFALFAQLLARFL